MSTKSSIKYGYNFHIYTDMIDDADPAPVYLEVSGVDFTAIASADGGTNVTIAMSRALAEQIGLLSDAALAAAKIKTAEAVTAEREACAKIAATAFGGPAHTYASENADVYRAQDDACARIAAAIRARGSSS